MTYPEAIRAALETKLRIRRDHEPNIHLFFSGSDLEIHVKDISEQCSGLTGRRTMNADDALATNWELVP